MPRVWQIQTSSLLQEGRGFSQSLVTNAPPGKQRTWPLMDQEQTRPDWTLTAARAIYEEEGQSIYAPVDLIQGIICEHMEPSLEGSPTKASHDESTDWIQQVAEEIHKTMAANETVPPLGLLYGLIRDRIFAHFDQIGLDMAVSAGGSVDIPGPLSTLIITAAEGSTVNVQNNVHELAIEQGGGGQVIFADGAAEASIIQGPGSVIQYNRANHDVAPSTH